MNLGLSTFRRFLKAEEVPRWFGLSVVVIYLVGLMAVGQFGIAQMRAEAGVQFRQNAQYAVKLLGDRLSAVSVAPAGEPEWIGTCSRMMREFSTNIPVHLVRVVNEGTRRIVASTDSAEIGAAAPEIPGASIRPEGLESTRLESAAGGGDQWLIRMPLVRLMQETGGSVDALAVNASMAAFHIEAVFPVVPPIRNHWIGRATTLGVVLVVLGALFLVYRCLRQQLRSVSRIADRLETHGDCLEQKIRALHIGDSLDVVTGSWNKLVELTQNLLESAAQKEANDELSRVLQRSSGGALAEAMNAVPDGIILVADENRFDYLNSAACRLLGWDLQAGEKPSLKDASAEGIGSKLLELLRGALLSDGRFDARVELLEAGDASVRDQSSYRVWLIPLQRGRRSGDCVVIIRDVSQQIRAERAREEFIAQVTHEFRTPLTNIRAYTETLSSGMFEDPQTISECYNVITKETRRLSRLIEDILSVSQLEIGSIELQLDNVDIKTLLAEGVRDVRGLADEKQIDLQIVLPAKLEPIRADRDKLAVVINNLLGNAIKYTNSGGNVIVGCQTSSESITITVKDNGMGIAPQDQARVFEKFQRGSDPEVQNITGTGIGLFTAREIVRRHGGDIELISEKGAGSTFMVRLPHRESRASAMSTDQTGGARG